MQVDALNIEGVCLVTPRRIADERGFFCETYSRTTFAKAGFDVTFVQDNQSLSRRAGTIRGLHYQATPHAQAKLVSVLRGRIFVVAIDLRRPSPTFGHHAAATLTSDTGQQLFLSTGFAHGFCTLEDNTEVFYKVSAPYAAASERGIAFDDPTLAIKWPVAPSDAILSDKDRRQPRFVDLQDAFA